MRTTLPLLLLFATPGWAWPPYAYIAADDNNAFGHVTVVDWTTNNTVADIPVAAFPTGIAVTPDGAFVYVLGTALFSGNPGAVSVIATSTNTVVATVPVEAANVSPILHGLAITPDGKFVYAATSNLTVISTATNSVVTVVPITSASAQNVAISPDGKFAYVTEEGLGALAIVATADNSMLGTISLPQGEIPGPSGVAIMPNGQFAWVSNSGALVEIAIATNTIVATIQLGIPLNLAITPDGAFVYVTDLDAGGIEVISTATRTLVASIPITFPGGSEPAALAISPDGALVYVPLVDEGQVVVINRATNTILTRIPWEQNFAEGDGVAFVPIPPLALPDKPQQLVVKGTQMCLDIQSYSYQPVTPAIQYWCEGGLNQSWLPTAVGDGSFTLTVQHSGEVLDVTGGSTAAGAQPIQYPYWGGSNQQWYFEPTVDGFYHVVSQNSGMCLDVVTEAQTPALTQQNTCGASDSQKWKFVPRQ